MAVITRSFSLFLLLLLLSPSLVPLPADVSLVLLYFFRTIYRHSDILNTKVSHLGRCASAREHHAYQHTGLGHHTRAWRPNLCLLRGTHHPAQEQDLAGDVGRRGYRRRERKRGCAYLKGKEKQILSQTPNSLL